MAEILEDLDSEDTNRKIDQCDFQANQFEIFTHEYREKTAPDCSAKEHSDHSECKQKEQKSNRAKKELVNITRKLQKAIVSLELMGSYDSTPEMLEKVRQINSKLRDIIVRNNAEFSQTSVPLPDYDETDMKCFLGDDEVEDQKPLLLLMKEENEKTKAELDATLFEAEVLLREFDHLKNGIKAREDKN